MKVFLMHRDRDFDIAQEPPVEARALTGDLGLEVLFEAMAGGDRFLRGVAETAVLCGLHEVAAIRYRQEVLRDCLANPAAVRDLYALSVAAIEGERKQYWGVSSGHPGSILHRSITVLQHFAGQLRQLRQQAEAQEAKFQSDGFRTLFAMLRRELDDAYLEVIEGHIARLRFRRGPLISAMLGRGNAGTFHVLRRPNRDERPLVQRLLTARRPACRFRIPERDEAGARILAELRDRGINTAANATAQSADHILSFFRMLRAELAFYIGCLNLHERLAARGMPSCIPDVAPAAQRCQAARGLYDPCLALASNREVVGNDIDGNDKELFVVTGANQGGKSTWLRAIGVSQLMTQCGLFAPARACRANLCSGLFVHFRREEDTEMRAGKFEEELQRISGIVDRLAPDGIVLFNGSLQSTNEREGSQIGRQIVEALLDSRVKIFFVTHMYDLAGGLYDKSLANAAFLRAERRDDGARTFRIVPGAPLSTSYGKDVYDAVFGAADAAPPRDGIDESDCQGTDPEQEAIDEKRPLKCAKPGGTALTAW